MSLAHRFIAMFVFCGLLSAPLSAVQLQDATLISPVTGQPFQVLMVPVERGGESLADMGTDEDGCRHSSSNSEYDYYVATCPYSYFSALSVEWDEGTGQFRSRLPDEVKQWAQKELNTEQKIDFERVFHSAAQVARAQGQPVPERKDFVMPQNAIPIEKRYRYALMCYEKRGARAAVLAKIAINGAWALRTRANIPLGHSAIDGGYQEVNAQAAKQVKDGEAFVFAKWLGIYRDIFENSRLSDEGYLVAGQTYFGFALRDGDLKIARSILAKMTERFKDNDKAEMLRGLVRERTTLLNEYLKFVDVAAGSFTRAIGDEEFTRQELPKMMLVVAESLRRLGREAESFDWYLALAKMPDTQPKLRDDIRAQNKAPGPDAPFEVQLGWIADAHLAELTKIGVVHGPDIGGASKKLLNAIVSDGLGTAAYVNPDWRPQTAGDVQDCSRILDLIGKSALDFTYRLGLWPKNLGELWERGYLKDRNRVNRFHCPVTGAEFLYQYLPAEVSKLPPRTVIVATAQPVPTNQGPRFGAFLLNNTVVWSDQPLVPGQVTNATAR